MASRASNWNHEELRKLVELWADVSIQAILDSKQKNTRAYDKIKVRLAAAGFIRTVAQINAKIKHLRRLYHKAKDAVQRSGVSADTAEGLCPQFTSIDAVIVCRRLSLPRSPWARGQIFRNWYHPEGQRLIWYF